MHIYFTPLTDTESLLNIVLAYSLASSKLIVGSTVCINAQATLAKASASQMPSSLLKAQLSSFSSFVTRSSVNAWEMGLSTPTTQYIVALAKLFHVSSDYILDIEADQSISLRSYTEEEVAIVLNLLRYFDGQH